MVLTQRAKLICKHIRSRIFDENSHLTYRLYLKLFKEATLLGKRHREKVLREEAEAEEDDQK